MINIILYISEGWKTLLKDYEKFENEVPQRYMTVFNSSENELINKIIKDFEGSLKLLSNYLLKLKETKDETTMKELLDQFFSKYHQITEKELAFNKKNYLELCENSQERYLLIFFQIQLTKYELLDSYSKSFAKILNDYFESNKKLIIDEYNVLKAQSNQLLNEMKEKNRIKSPKTLFIEWKFTKCITIKNGFYSFIEKIKNYVGSVELRFNDDLISDQITSLWIVKNDLEQYMD